MPQNTDGSFDPWMPRKRFNGHPHGRFKNLDDDSFESDEEETDAQTVARDVQEALADAERQIEKLPKDYGDAVRRAMHRDICLRLAVCVNIARKEAFHFKHDAKRRA